MNIEIKEPQNLKEGDAIWVEYANSFKVIQYTKLETHTFLIGFTDKEYKYYAKSSLFVVESPLPSFNMEELKMEIGSRLPVSVYDTTGKIHVELTEPAKKNLSQLLVNVVVKYMREHNTIMVSRKYNFKVLGVIMLLIGITGIWTDITKTGVFQLISYIIDVAIILISIFYLTLNIDEHTDKTSLKNG